MGSCSWAPFVADNREAGYPLTAAAAGVAAAAVVVARNCPLQECSG